VDESHARLTHLLSGAPAPSMLAALARPPKSLAFRKNGERMSLGRIEKRLGVTAAAVAAISLGLAAAGGDARADGPVSPTGKGIVGGALLGGEVVTITLAAVGVERGWPYWVFGGVGMVGGGVGGYFVEVATKKSTPATAEPALYMLAGGMALIIPALVLSLNATAYKPPESDRAEPGNEPSKNTPAPGKDGTIVQPPKAAPPGATPPPSTKRDAAKPSRHARAPIRHIPLSLLDVYKNRLAVGVPALELRPLYTQREVFQYGVTQGTEVHVPVFKAMF
jgi:hypothetical protein